MGMDVNAFWSKMNAVQTPGNSRQGYQLQDFGNIQKTLDTNNRRYGDGNDEVRNILTDLINTLKSSDSSKNLDVNGDGYVTREELDQYAKRDGKPGLSASDYLGITYGPPPEPENKSSPKPPSLEGTKSEGMECVGLGPKKEACTQNPQKSNDWGIRRKPQEEAQPVEQKPKEGNGWVIRRH